MNLKSIKNFFKRETLNTIYLAGWEVLLNGDDKCYNFIETQNLSLQDLEHFDSGLQLVFKDEQLSKAFEFYELTENGFDWQEKDLKPNEVGLEFREFQSNRFIQLEENPKGINQLGGKPPKELKFPNTKCVVPFQYLGFIDNTDPSFKWLPFKLNLICPIYLNFRTLYIDYSSPNAPKVINLDDIESFETSFADELNENSIIEYDAIKFSSVPNVINWKNLIGSGGIPNWIQYPDIPTCPRSGKRMKFLVQLSKGPKTKYIQNVNLENESLAKYFENMNFWGDGELYVFFEPSSKTVCYLIQNT